MYRSPFFAALLTAAAVVASAAEPASAQDVRLTGGDSELVDRVVAIVGDSVILQSQIEEELIRRRAQGMTLPTDPVARQDLEREILDQLVNELVLLQAALADTLITVDDDRLDRIVEDDIENRIRVFGSRAALQEALEAQGMTLTGYRELIREQARRSQLQQAIYARRSRQVTNVQVDESEIRALYESQRARVAERPATLTFRQVVVQPEPSDSAKATARAEAERVLELARSGEEEFESLARRFSDDPASRQLGGDLGWFRRGVMVEPFEDAVFSMREGQVSDVVETSFGFHVIKLERVRGGERKARHVLIRPETGPGDADRARERAREIRGAVDEGASLKELAEEHDFPGAPPDSIEIQMDRLQESLPPGYAEPLRGAEVGDVVGPLEFQLQGETFFAVMKVLEMREAGEFSYEELRDQIRDRLRQQKVFDRILEELRRGMYLEIRY